MKNFKNALSIAISVTKSFFLVFYPLWIILFLSLVVSIILEKKDVLMDLFSIVVLLAIGFICIVLSEMFSNDIPCNTKRKRL